MRNMIRFVKEENGATAIEYGLLAALVGVVIITGLKILGPSLSSTFSSIGNTLTAAQ